MRMIAEEFHALRIIENDEKRMGNSTALLPARRLCFVMLLQFVALEFSRWGSR